MSDYARVTAEAERLHQTAVEIATHVGVGLARGDVYDENSHTEAEAQAAGKPLIDFSAVLLCVRQAAAEAAAAIVWAEVAQAEDRTGCEGAGAAWDTAELALRAAQEAIDEARSMG